MSLRDDRLKQDVVDKLYWDGRLDASLIRVHVKAGKAVLTGTVVSASASVAAESAASAVPGILEVENLLETYANGYPVPGDNELLNCVVDIFQSDPDFDASKVCVTVKFGLIRLDGIVDALWKKTLAEDLARRLPGVRGVKNQLVVVPTHDRLDEAIAQDLLKSLMRHTEIDADSLHVQVNGQVVRLDGTVPGLHAAKAIRQIARQTQGVVDLEDGLRIAAE